jgi:hypothetical protein
VVQVSLAQTEEFSVTHKTPEFQRRVEIEVFAENEVVWDFRNTQAFGSWLIDRLTRFRVCIVESVVQIMCDEITTLEKHVNIIWSLTLEIVCDGNPRRIFWCTPVQLWRYFPAQFLDSVLYLIVNFGPSGRRIVIFIIILFVIRIFKTTVVVGEGRTCWLIWRKDDSVCAKVGNEGVCQGDKASFGCASTVPADKLLAT